VALRKHLYFHKVPTSYVINLPVVRCATYSPVQWVQGLCWR